MGKITRLVTAIKSLMFALFYFNGDIILLSEIMQNLEFASIIFRMHKKNGLKITMRKVLAHLEY